MFLVSEILPARRLFNFTSCIHSQSFPNGKSSQSKAFPDKNVQSKAFPGKHFQIKAFLGKNLQGRDSQIKKFQGKDSQIKKFQIKDSHIQNFQGKGSQIEHFQDKDFQRKNVQNKDSQSKDFQIKGSQIKDSQIKHSKIKDSHIKDSQIKDSQIKDFQIKDSQSKDLQGKYFLGKDSQNKYSHSEGSQGKDTQTKYSQNETSQSKDSHQVFQSKDSHQDSQSKNSRQDSQSKNPHQDSQSKDSHQDSQSKDSHQGSQGKESHKEDFQSKEPHKPDFQSKDSHKASQSKESHRNYSQSEDSHGKDSHGKDAHVKDSQLKDSHGKDSHGKDPHEKDSHRKYSQNKSSQNKIPFGTLLNSTNTSILLGGTALGILLYYSFFRNKPQPLLPPLPVINTTEKIVIKKEDKENLRENFNFIDKVVRKCADAVVYVEIKDPRRTDAVTGEALVISNGSGFIIREEGWLITNAHVVISKPQAIIVVKLNDGTSYKASVEDADMNIDIALLKVDCDRKLPTLKLGDSSTCSVGEWVVALGSPLSLSHSVTAGVISSINREAEELGLRNHSMKYIQTDAAITFGNSGGPLVNLDGDVIGINNLRITAGISFAIPIDYAKRFVNSSILSAGFQNKQKALPPRQLGITTITITQDIVKGLLQKYRSIPDYVSHGIFVWKVQTGTVADNPRGLSCQRHILELDSPCS